MMPGDGGKMITASLESLIVHEGQHAFDFNIASKGNISVYKEKYVNIFVFPRHLWNDYPNQTEYNAVKAENAYRATVGEQLRSRYNANTGDKGLSETMDYYMGRSVNWKDADRFRDKVKEYNDANSGNQIDLGKIKINAR